MIILAVVLFFVFVIICTAASYSRGDTNTNIETVSAVSSAVSEDKSAVTLNDGITSQSGEEVLIYDDNNIKGYVVGVRKSGCEYKLNMYFENATGKDIAVAIGSSSVNDFAAIAEDGWFFKSVPNGERAYDTLSLHFDSEAMRSTDTSAAIKFMLRVICADDGSDIVRDEVTLTL